MTCVPKGQKLNTHILRNRKLLGLYIVSRPAKILRNPYKSMLILRGRTWEISQGLETRVSRLEWILASYI